MDLETMKKLILRSARRSSEFVKKAEVAERYYRKQNDVLKGFKKYDENGNPLRNADNRIASNFHNILVNQKASYLFTAAPIFDVGNEKANTNVAEVLGDSFAKTCKDLCVRAANASIGWLHYWVDDDNNFRFGVIKNSAQITPIWSDDFEQSLIALLRSYQNIDPESGKVYDIYEYWDENTCYAFRKENKASIASGLEPYQRFHFEMEAGDMDTNVITHDFAQVPFIPFRNNDIETTDLETIKELIDCYDKVYSGFINDLDDIQELIFILAGYEDEPLDTFLKKLKKYKTFKADITDDGKAGLSTLAIDIPVEARDKALELTRKAIFEQGQGIDPDPQHFGSSSGEALKHLYDLLELKAGLVETEFRSSFGQLIRAICRNLGFVPGTIIQTWYRTKISNDNEMAEIANKSKGIISDRTIIQNHPWVDDVENELKQIDKEKQDEIDNYSGAFDNPVDEDETS